MRAHGWRRLMPTKVWVGALECFHIRARKSAHVCVLHLSVNSLIPRPMCESHERASMVTLCKFMCRIT